MPAPGYTQGTSSVPAPGYTQGTATGPGPGYAQHMASVPVPGYNQCMATVPTTVPVTGSALSVSANAVQGEADWNSEITDDLLLQSAISLDSQVHRLYNNFTPVFNNCSNITINFNNTPKF
jgi:hypothetical protein